MGLDTCRVSATTVPVDRFPIVVVIQAVATAAEYVGSELTGRSILILTLVFIVAFVRSGIRTRRVSGAKSAARPAHGQASDEA